MKIIGVTKCPTGIAHTYIAAEKIEQTAKKLGYEVKVETQGSQGTENKLTSEEIKNADYVIIAADVAIDEKERFDGKYITEISIKNIIKNSETIIKNLKNSSILYKEKNIQVNKDSAKNSNAIKQLMNGASHMIPFVVVGGLFIALALAIGGIPTSEGMIIKSTFWNKVNQIGALGFDLMYPILAGFIAFSISGRASLAPAMISAKVAVSPEILGTEAGTGFLGCIVVGYAAGYLVKFMNSWKVPKTIKPVMPIFVIPLLGVGIISSAFILILGKPVAWLMTNLNIFLGTLSENSSTGILLGIILGALVAIDMGGPFNKVAFLFGVASITEGNPQIMGAVACAIPVPPLAMGLATLINKNVFTDEERGSGISALLMGLIGITEGAIPFASADPKRVLPSIIIGSSVASSLGMIFNITDNVPHGGPIVGFLGATNNLPLFLTCIAIGSLVSAMMIVILKNKKLKKLS
jgi:PTS system fructose-specific IIC component/PTS system mannose-specific IIC component